MIEIISKFKKKLTDKNLWIFAIITIIFFGPFWKLDYATDSYCIITTEPMQYIHHFLYSGRFITALAEYVITFLKISTYNAYLCSYLAGIISITTSMYILYNIFKDNIKDKVLLILATILIIINIFSIELFLFFEKGVLALSILFSVLAFKYFVNFLKGKHINLIFILLFMLLANFSYQGTVGIFVALSAIFIISEYKNLKFFFINNIILAICYGLPAIFNYLLVRFVFANGRVNGKYILLDSLNKIYSSTKNMLINTYNIFPKYLFIIGVLIVILISLFFIFKIKENLKGKFLKILSLAYIFIMTLLVTIFPQLAQSTASIGFAPRNTYVIASLIGLILIYLLYNIPIYNKYISKILVCFIILFLTIQYVNFDNIIKNRYILNYVDQYNAFQIKELVDEYELETENKISKVCYYEKEKNDVSYPNLYSSGDINVKATCPIWSRTDYLELYLERYLNVTEDMPTDIYNYFNSENWSYFDIRQCVTKDDTLYMYIF